MVRKRRSFHRPPQPRLLPAAPAGAFRPFLVLAPTRGTLEHDPFGLKQCRSHSLLRHPGSGAIAVRFGFSGQDARPGFDRPASLILSSAGLRPEKAGAYRRTAAGSSGRSPSAGSGQALRYAPAGAVATQDEGWGRRGPGRRDRASTGQPWLGAGGRVSVPQAGCAGWSRRARERLFLPARPWRLRKRCSVLAWKWTPSAASASRSP